jgi:hypothetical protein
MVSQELQGEFIRENVVESFIPFLVKLNRFLKIKLFPIYLIVTTIKWCKSSQTVGHHLKFLSLRKPFMLGKNGIKVFDHIFLQKLTLTFLGDHSLTPCID